MPVPYARRTRRTALIVASLVAGTATLLATGAPADAHAVLEKTSPAKNATLSSPPAEVVLTFDEPPQQLGNVVRVTGPAGIVSQGNPTLKGAEIHQPLTPSLPNGPYRVDWRAVSDDGHPVSGTFAFTVNQSGEAAAATTGPTPTTSTATAASSPSTAATALPSTSTAQDTTNPWPVLIAIGALLLLLIGFAVWRFTRHTTESP